MAESHHEEIAKLEALYANNPEGRVFTHLAEAYRKAGELERAREILEDGLRRHADYASAHVVMGRVLADQGDPDAAAGSFRRVLELDRHNLVALRSLGEISSEAGHTDEALHYYRELLSLDPSDERLRSTVRSLEERREAEAAAALAPAAAEEVPAGEPGPEAVPETPPSEPTGEPPAFPAGEPVGMEEAEPVAAGEGESVTAGEGEPEAFIAGPAAAFAAEGAEDEGAPAEPPEEVVLAEAAEGESEERPAGDAFAAGVSQDWEQDVGIELEPLPGDLAALTDEPVSAEPIEGLETTAAGEEWAVTGEWLSQPPADPLASGLDLGIEGEEIGRVEVPASDLELTEPAGEDLTPFDMPSGPLDLAPEEPNEPTPFDLPDTADAADVPPETVYGAIGSEEGFGIDVGPATPEFGGPPPSEFEEAAEPEPAAAAWAEPEPAEQAWAAPEPAEHAWAEPEVESAEGELATETLAELYFAQGAYDRAADVYRSLLRDRPGDVRLQERLAEAESYARPPIGAEEDAAEGWLEGVESAWTGGRGVAGAETTPYAWAEPGAEDTPAGPPVGEYFGALLSWRPGAGGQAAPQPEPSAGEDAALPGEELAYEAAETEAPAYLPADALEEQPEGGEATPAEPWNGAAGEVQAPELPEAASVAGADEEGDDDEDLEMFRSWLQSLRK